MDLRPLDLADASALADAYAVECEATRHDRPGWVPLGEAARILSWRADDGWLRSLVGAFEGAPSVRVRDPPGRGSARIKGPLERPAA